MVIKRFVLHDDNDKGIEIGEAAIEVCQAQGKKHNPNLTSIEMAVRDHYKQPIAELALHRDTTGEMMGEIVIRFFYGKGIEGVAEYKLRTSSNVSPDMLQATVENQVPLLASAILDTQDRPPKERFDAFCHAVGKALLKQSGRDVDFFKGVEDIVMKPVDPEKEREFYQQNRGFTETLKERRALRKKGIDESHLPTLPPIVPSR